MAAVNLGRIGGLERGVVLAQQAIEQALAGIERIDRPDFVTGHVFGAAVAAHTGRLPRVHRVVEEIRRLHPSFSGHGRELIGRWDLDPRVQAALADDLELVGLPLT